MDLSNSDQCCPRVNCAWFTTKETEDRASEDRPCLVCLLQEAGGSLRLCGKPGPESNRRDEVGDCVIRKR